MKKAEKLHELMKLIIPLSQKLHENMAQELEGTGLSVLKRAILEIISDQGQQTVPNIARSLEYERQHIQAQVNDMYDSGILDRLENAAHKKSMLLQLTSDGEKLIKKIRSKERRTIKKIANALPANKIQTSIETVSYLISGLDK